MYTTSLSNFSLLPYPLPDDKISEWSKMKQIADDVLKGLITLFALNIWLFPVFVNDTFMRQYFRQEIRQKRTFEVNKNIFIPKPEPILS